MITEMAANEANHNATGRDNEAPTSKSCPVASHGQESGGTNESQRYRDCQEQVLALLRALELLAEMAADSSSLAVAARQLDDLQSKWKLEDTHVPQLRNSIERLQSTVMLLQEDADSHATQMQSLQHELYSSNSRVRKLEKAVQKLHKKNEQLRRKTETHKKSLVNQVKTFVEKKNEDEQLHHLAAHERLLKMEGNRSRCSSRDFSDADEEMSSVSSVSSFVTDDGVATVRYSPALVHDERTLVRKAHDYGLTFPQGTKIGLQFHKVLLEEEKSQRGLLNDAIQDTAEYNVTPSKELPFSMHFNFDSFRGKHHDEDYMYLVCGHYGFDRDLNTQPALGARLVKVNGESVQHMALDKIKAAIKCTKREFFSLTFRNEMLSPKQKDMLDSAIHVTRQQYEGSGNNNFESLVESKAKPVIICMHEEGPSRLSTFLNSARSRTYSDNALRGDLTSSERDEWSKDAVASPPARGFYSILHGDSSSKLDSDIVKVGHNDLASCEPLPPSEDVCLLETTGSRLSSMFNSARNRTLSDNAVPTELASIEREESPKNVLTSPSKRVFYSILHGDASSKIDSNPDIPVDHVNNDREVPSESIGASETSGSRLSSMINNARIRTFSDSAVRVNLPGRDRERHPEDASFIHGSCDQSEPIRDDLATHNHGSPPRSMPSGEEALATETPPSEKLKKSMKSVGNKFKSLF